MAREALQQLPGRVGAVIATAFRQVLVALLDRRLRLFAGAFVVGQVCDTVTTHAALSSGRFAEANPFFAPALLTHPGLATILKLLLAAAVLTAAITKLAEPRRRTVLMVLAVISLEAPATNALKILGVL